MIIARRVSYRRLESIWCPYAAVFTTIARVLQSVVCECVKNICGVRRKGARVNMRGILFCGRAHVENVSNASSPSSNAFGRVSSRRPIDGKPIQRMLSATWKWISPARAIPKIVEQHETGMWIEFFFAGFGRCAEAFGAGCWLDGVWLGKTR